MYKVTRWSPRALKSGHYCVRRRQERLFENNLRAHCREHGLDFESELKKFKDWEKSERVITYFCLGIIIVCLFCV